MKKFILAVGMLSLVAAFLMPVFVSADEYDGYDGPPANALLSQNQGSADGDGSGNCRNLDSGGLKGVVNCIIGIFDWIIVLLVAGGVVMVIYGAFLMITSEEKRASGRQTVIYGIVGLFVMVSVWGLVRILQSTFTLTNTPISAPSLLKAQ